MKVQPTATSVHHQGGHTGGLCAHSSPAPPPQPSPTSGSSHQPHSSQNPKVSSCPHPNQQWVRSILSPARPPPASSPPRPSLPSLLPPHCPEPILNALFTPCSGRLMAPGTRRMKSRLQTYFKTTVQLVLESGTCPVPHCTPACDSGPGTRSGRGGQGLPFQNLQGWDSPRVWGRNQLLRHLFLHLQVCFSLFLSSHPGLTTHQGRPLPTHLVLHMSLVIQFLCCCGSRLGPDVSSSLMKPSGLGLWLLSCCLLSCTCPDSEVAMGKQFRWTSTPWWMFMESSFSCCFSQGESESASLSGCKILTEKET